MTWSSVSLRDEVTAEFAELGELNQHRQVERLDWSWSQMKARSSAHYYARRERPADWSREKARSLACYYAMRKRTAEDYRVVCPECSVSFVQRIRGRQIYCSARCSVRVFSKRANAQAKRLADLARGSMAVTCRGCGQTFAPTKRKDQVYCTHVCRQKIARAKDRRHGHSKRPDGQTA